MPRRTVKKTNKVLPILAILIVITVLGWHFLKPSSSPVSQKANESSESLSSDTEAQQKLPIEDKELEQLLATWTNGRTAEYGISVREITGDLRFANYNGEAKMVPASTYKLYAAYAILHAIENGEYSLNYTLSTGQTVTECLSDMIINSDNECGRAIGFLLGWENINTLLRSQGFSSTELNNYIGSGTDPVGDKTTTAQTLALFLTKLEKSQLLNEDHTTLLKNLMKEQVWRERIPAGISSSVVIADKPGWLDNIQTDAAIVYGEQSTYIVVILSTEDSPQPLAELSTKIYEYLQAKS